MIPWKICNRVPFNIWVKGWVIFWQIFSSHWPPLGTDFSCYFATAYHRHPAIGRRAFGTFSSNCLKILDNLAKQMQDEWWKTSKINFCAITLTIKTKPSEFLLLLQLCPGILIPAIYLYIYRNTYITYSMYIIYSPRHHANIPICSVCTLVCSIRGIKLGTQKAFLGHKPQNRKFCWPFCRSANYLSRFCKSINFVGCFLLSFVQIRKCCWPFCKFANFVGIFF